MPRILGVDIPNNKRLDIGLTYIYGIGKTRAKELCEQLQLDPNTKTSELADADIARIAQALQSNFTVEGDLRRQVAQDIRRLVSIKSYRGNRHQRGLPARGQRTKTNARTRKGGKKTDNQAEGGIQEGPEHGDGHGHAEGFVPQDVPVVIQAGKAARAVDIVKKRGYYGAYEGGNADKSRHQDNRQQLEHGSAQKHVIRRATCRSGCRPQSNGRQRNERN